MRILFAVIIMLAGFPPEGSAQERGEGGRVMERVEQLRKLRLIETLDLSEEQSVRFFARLNDHDKKKKDLHEQKMSLLDRLDRMVRNQVAASEYSGEFSEILELDTRLAAEDNKFFEGLSDILPEEQRAKFLLFGRQFQKELREAMREIQKRRQGVE